MVLGSLPVGHNRRRTIVWPVSPSTWVAKVGGVKIGVEINTHVKGTNPIPRKTDTHSGDPGGGRKKGANKNEDQEEATRHSRKGSAGLNVVQPRPLGSVGKYFNPSFIKASTSDLAGRVRTKE